MSNIDPLIERNRAFAATDARQDLPLIPRQQAFLITCLDPRVDPSLVLGLEPGDAMVVRNAGGRVTPAVIQDVAFIAFLGEQMSPDGPLFEVAIIHHTQCGTGFLADEMTRRAFAGRTAYGESALAATAVTDPAATVRADVERLLTASQVSPRISVSGTSTTWTPAASPPSSSPHPRITSQGLRSCRHVHRREACRRDSAAVLPGRRPP